MATHSPGTDDDVRELAFKVRLRAAGVEADSIDRLFDEWRAVARGRELDPDESAYWSAAADWLLVRVSPSLGRPE